MLVRTRAYPCWDISELSKDFRASRDQSKTFANRFVRMAPHRNEDDHNSERERGQAAESSAPRSRANSSNYFDCPSGA